MKQKKSQAKEFTAAEIQLIEQLREHPEMRVRMQSILEIARNAAGPLKTADEVEELLVEAMRRLAARARRGMSPSTDRGRMTPSTDRVA